MTDNGFVLELTEDWVKPENPYDRWIVTTRGRQILIITDNGASYTKLPEGNTNCKFSSSGKSVKIVGVH